MPIFPVRKLRLREANDLSKIPQLVRGSCSQPDHLFPDTELLATFKILVHFLCLISYFQLGKGTWIISKRLGNPGRRPWRRGWDWIGPTPPNWVPWNRTVLHKLSLPLVLFQPSANTKNILFVSGMNESGRSKLGRSWGKICVCVQRDLGFNFIIKQHLY